MSDQEDIPRSLIPMYREQYEAGEGCLGRSILHWELKIRTLCRRHQTQTVLDYGCGNAEAYTAQHIDARWRAKVTLFDPANPKYSDKPSGKFDGVICCDVLEHVPEGELPAFLDDVFGYAKKWVFFSVCCRPAKRLLPDGQNAHVTVKPYEWWHSLVSRHAPNGVRWKLREAE